VTVATLSLVRGSVDTACHINVDLLRQPMNCLFDGPPVTLMEIDHATFSLRIFANLVRDFAETAAKRLRQYAAGDAPESTKTPTGSEY
jgi:hypothetical protein